MKLDILLVFVSFMGIVKGTTNEEWVGDLEKVTKWLTQIPSSPQGNSRVVWYRFYEYSLKLSNAANRQRIAARPAPPSGKGAEMHGSACSAISDYFPKLAATGIEAMDYLLDPKVACAKETKDLIERPFSKWHENIRRPNNDWDEYDTAFVANCQDEDPSRIFFQQTYIPLKRKVQQFTDAYQDLNKYCTTKD
ncbi:hypothetical protein N7481_001414 [Penicillium waksmanii]|uniref:uncharacterized protein n=1 Tax=Penicillium waksmanii TaxID=69791 RepID=UPI0025488D4E|nr:uncharacterized protein N7481_001414 [Penicillium waksmanii]KAJ6001005.1 hypothetical protein N7481_001414 [Penicillium waksmanii]